ncbi:MAG: FtsX-like permease family protein [Ignavibacteria bacterium]|nr:FtsX-like permease family protein [Ignavibacteria bacterium]
MLLGEIVVQALRAIKANKLRSTLTLLGIVVGVFSIIGVMTAVRVLQNSIESGLSVLGTHTFQIQKFPAIIMGHGQWRRYRNRKDITLEQAKDVERRITTAEFVGIEGSRGGSVVQYRSLKTNPNVRLYGLTPNGIPTNNWSIKEGRGIDNSDERLTGRVVVLGNDVVQKLFPVGGAVGSDIRIRNEPFRVIGTFEPKGSAFGGDSDNMVVVPLNTFLSLYGKDRSLRILVKAKSPEVYDECVDEARLILRTSRKVDPAEEDDFSIFSNDSLIDTFNEFTLYVKLGIGFISFIALLAAGVGIMNIMLVSVTERTREIGLRKSLGARKSSILNQFVIEAIVLCQMGGIVGIGVGILAGNLAAVAFSIPPVFPVDWALIGFGLCAFIGLVFGVYPAWKAANLDPIEALRFE